MCKLPNWCMEIENRTHGLHSPICMQNCPQQSLVHFLPCKTWAGGGQWCLRRLILGGILVPTTEKGGPWCCLGLHTHIKSFPAAFLRISVEERKSLRMRLSRIMGNGYRTSHRTKKKHGKKKKTVFSPRKMPSINDSLHEKRKMDINQAGKGLLWFSQRYLLKWTTRKRGLWDCQWGPDRHLSAHNASEGFF